MISQLMDGEKEYLATIRLGIETTTLDPEGEVTATKPVGSLSATVVEECLLRFRGEQMQVPPIYSALKHKGKPLYYYARKGIAIEKPPRSITIFDLERTDENLELNDASPYLTIRVVCSKGTYIRTLGADIGRVLGCGGYLTALRRVRSGCFHVRDSVEGHHLLEEDAKERLMNNVLSVTELCNLLQ
jgi:tRNA pseudouridine55 synthase